MKQTLTFLPFLFLFLFSCNNYQDISGHWHIKSEQSIDRIYITMDLSDDSIGFLGKHSIYGATEGFYNSKEKIIFFPGDCGVFQFEYKLRGDKLYLKNYLENRVAERCDHNCCNKLIDLKKDIKIKINFPQIIKNRKALKPIPLYEERLIENISIGIPKDTSAYKLEEKKYLFLNRKQATFEDLQNWIEMVRKRQAEPIRDRISYRIFADKSISTNELKLVIDELKKNGVKRILLTCLKENYDIEEEMFEYIYINNIDLDGYKKLGDILN